MGSNGGYFQGNFLGHPVQVVPGLAGANCLNARQHHASVFWGQALANLQVKAGDTIWLPLGASRVSPGRLPDRGSGYHTPPIRLGLIPDPSKPGRF